MMRWESLHHWDGEKYGRDLVGELADGDLPGCGLPSEVEDDLGSYAVDSAVEDPAESRLLVEAFKVSD